MEEIKFKSITDLYRRLLPALNAKCSEVNNLYHCSSSELDVWNYLKIYVWKESKDLLLCDMVSNIINLDNDKFYEYYKERRIKY